MARRFKLRPTAVIPALFSAAAFALALVLVVAGTRPGTAEDFYLLSINTSDVGSQTIRFTPVDTGSDDGDGSGGPLGAIGDFFGDIIDGLTETVDNELQNLEEELVNGVVDALGIKDSYTLFLRKICEGTLGDPDDPTSVELTACHAYDDENQGFNNVTSSIPSSVVVGTTNISVPILTTIQGSFSSLQSTTNISVPILTTIQGSFSSLQSTTDTVTAAVFALTLIGVITTGLVVLLSLVAVVLRPNVLVVATLALVTTSATALFLAATTSTAVATVVASFVNGFGEALSLNVNAGTKFIQLIWISWALSVVANLYWFAVWFVEVRKNSFQRRHRTEEQMGNWRGIMQELKSDMTVERKMQ